MHKKIPTTIKNPDLVAQRRQEIIDVATRLFLDRGFHNTSIRDIARACPFNLASLYMYITSKEDILFLVAQQLIDEKARAMAAVEMFEDDPATSFRTALQSYCRIVHKYRPHIRLLYRELDVLPPERREIVMSSLHTVTDVFEGIVRNGIAKGVFADVDPKLVALNALFLCHLWSMHARALRTIAADIDTFFELQCKIMLSGLLARAGEKQRGRTSS
jgi:TetR/AcrR family transcriptional regulator, cholesterol catabolism regulator